MLICDYSMETLMICYNTKHDDKIKAIAAIKQDAINILP